jgi:hypothetical protein
MLALLFSLTQPEEVHAEGDIPPVPESSTEINQPENVPIEIPQTEIQLELMPNAVPDGLDVVVLSQEGTALTLASNEAAAVLDAPDPFLTSGGVLYSFTMNDCDPLLDGLQPCPDPIQQAVNFAAAGHDPDDGTIYVGNGVFNENVSVDGFVFTGPISLHKITSQNGSNSTTLNGGFSIINILDFSLNGFTINGNIFVEDTEGTLTLTDMNVSGAEGHGITVYNHHGNIVVDGVKSHNNNGNGLYINNLDFDSIYGLPENISDSQISTEYFAPSIIITRSEFTNNFGNGIDIQSMSDVIIQHIKANENFWNGVSFMSLPFYVTFVDIIGEEAPRFSNISIYRSEFNQNGQFFLDQKSKESEFPKEKTLDVPDEELYSYGNGIVGVGGNFFIDLVEANANGISGSSTVSFGNTLIKCSVFNGNGISGLNAFGFGEVTMKGVTAAGNGNSEINAYGLSGTSEVTYKCEKVKNTQGAAIIPVTGVLGGDTCGVDGTLLELVSQDNKAIFSGLCPLHAALVGNEQSSLPGGLPEDRSFISGFTASVLQEGMAIDVIPEGGSITISFYLPVEMKDKTLSIYYWDPGHNAGSGGWIEISSKGNEASFTPADDAKQVLSGGRVDGDGYYGAIVNFSGTFVLMANN